jgi:hypothetical protein
VNGIVSESDGSLFGLNHPPVAGDLTVQIDSSTTGVGNINLLKFSSDPDSGDSISLDVTFPATTTQGGIITAATLPGYVNYTAPASGPVVDSFAFTVVDSRGGSSTGTLYITVHFSGGVGSITGDPEFVGIHGEQYKIRGEDQKWFSIVTASDFQFNGFFEKACDGKYWTTGITKLAIKIGKHKFMFNNTGMGQLDGVPLQTAYREKPYLVGPDGIDGKIVHPWVHHFEIATKEFSMTFERHMIDFSIQKPGMMYYGTNCIVGYFNMWFRDINIDPTKMHGLLGQTARHVHHLFTEDNDEGQREIEGTYKDYEVSGPFEDDFKFNKYRL